MNIIRKLFIAVVALLVISYVGMVIYAYLPFGENIPIAELAQPEDNFVDVDGINIRYRTWGEPAEDRPAIVLIHGFANSQQSFRLVGPARICWPTGQSEFFH